MDERRPLADRLRPYLQPEAPPSALDALPPAPAAPVPDAGPNPPTAPRPESAIPQAGTAPRPESTDAPQPGPAATPPAAAAPPAAPASHAPNAAPRTSSSAADFTEAAMLRPAAPAADGWRRILQVASLGTYQPKPTATQRAQAALLERIRTPVDGCRRIAVISRKGGVGKTTTTLMLGHALAQHRGDRVVALDGNPDAGSLGYRVAKETDATITDLLDRAAALTGYPQMRRFTSQAGSRLEVVASDDDPHISQAIGEQEYREAIELLERYYNLILLDTGTGILDSATQGILRMADQLVVVLAGSLDSSRAAGLTLDWLESHGYSGLVAGAVAVINQAHSRGLVEVLRVEDHFRARCRDVIRVPWDRRLEAGGQADLDDLEPATRQAYLDLAASVADGFRPQQG
jgi:putative peptide zinc metalloprotease protein